MSTTILRILGRYLASLITASLAIFVVMRLIPGDPARIALGTNATEDAVEKLSHTLGTDRPLVEQYFSWITGIIRGDFGVSLSSGTEVTALIVDRAQVSLILCFTAMALSIIVAIPVGMYLALRARRVDGLVISAVTQLGIAVPSFLVAILAIGVVSVRWGVLPASGWVAPNQDFSDFLNRLILPVISLALVQAAILSRYVRAGVLEELGKDHIRTARAIGLTRTRALARHGLRGALLPVVTIMGVQLTALIVGAVVIERVFFLPGLGSMLLDAVATRDIPVVQTIVMLLVVFTLTVNALIDVSYRLLDPRLKTIANAAPATARQVS